MDEFYLTILAEQLGLDPGRGERDNVIDLFFLGYFQDITILEDETYKLRLWESGRGRWNEPEYHSLESLVSRLEELSCQNKKSSSS